MGGEIISLNCCKWLQINRPFFQAVTDLSEGRKSIDGGSNPSSACKFRSKLKGAIDSQVIRTGRLKTGKLDFPPFSCLQRANPIIAEELARRGWQESELAARRRSDPGKVAIPARLRSETTLPIKWIAARGQIGTAKGAKSVLHHLAQSQDQRKAARALEPCAQLEFQSTV